MCQQLAATVIGAELRLTNKLLLPCHCLQSKHVRRVLITDPNPPYHAGGPPRLQDIYVGIISVSGQDLGSFKT